MPKKGGKAGKAKKKDEKRQEPTIRRKFVGRQMSE